jgi:viologen exporter family transport system permease protein
MRVYWELAKLGFRRASAYRTAAVSGAITNTFFGFLRAYIFSALYESRADVAGYTLADILAFTFIAQSMVTLVGLIGWWPIAESIQSGDVVSDLSRPYDYQAAWLAQEYGRALVHLLTRSVPCVAVGALFFSIPLPTDPLVWLGAAASLVLAIAVSFGWRFSLNLTAFWLTDHRGIAGIALMIAMLLTGFMLPLGMWPDRLREVVMLLPFAAMVSIPIDVILGKLHGVDLLAALALQALWALVMLGLGRLVLIAALRKLVVQGG